MLTYSVIVPAYRATDVLPRCLAALCDQSLARDAYEIIVVDDGSPDQTADVAEKVLSNANGRVIRAPHGGPAHARNLGAQAARGAILAFTDADCEPAHDWLERLTAPLRDETVTGTKGVYRTRQKSLVARFVQGLGASGPRIVGTATLQCRAEAVDAQGRLRLWQHTPQPLRR